MTGTMETMTMSDGATVAVYHAQPTGERRGGVVLVQEIFGVTDHIRDLCDEYAADGYEALAPALFDRENKRLRDWDPTRGCTLDTYVRMVARSKALDILRSRRRTPWQHDDAELDDGEGPSDERPDHESIVIAKESLGMLARILHELLGPRDYSLFFGLFVDEQSPVDVAAAMGMTPAAVYQWSSRFRRHMLPRLIRVILGDPQPI